MAYNWKDQYKSKEEYEEAVMASALHYKELSETFRRDVRELQQETAELCEREEQENNQPQEEE